MINCLKSVDNVNYIESLTLVRHIIIYIFHLLIK